MKLSIVICLYNTDRTYFEKCLSSIINSTLDKSEYQICVVDDGSTVNYGDLVEKYSLKYVKTENRGIFAARLKGIEIADGDYLIFVDSDDTVSFNYHRPMLECAIKNYCDIVINDWAFHTERSRYYCKADSTISRDLRCEGDDVLLRFVKAEGTEHSYYVLWNKLFRTSVMRSAANEITHIAERTERFNYAEDALMTFFAYRAANRLMNVHTGYYFYRIHSNQSVNVINDSRLARQIECMGEVIDTMLCSIGDNIHAEEIATHIKGWAALMSRTHYAHARAGGYTHLYDKIKQTYGVEALRLATFNDSRAYSNNKIIPDNFDEIDNALLSLWNDDGTKTITLKGTDAYMRSSIKYMNERGRHIKISSRGNKLPKPRARFINKILLNRFVYSFGLILFKKGSRIRNFLKKRL